MELSTVGLAYGAFTSVFLGLAAIALGIALIFYGFRGRASQVKRSTKFRSRP